MIFQDFDIFLQGIKTDRLAELEDWNLACYCCANCTKHRLATHILGERQAIHILHQKLDGRGASNLTNGCRTAEREAIQMVNTL